jgi:hypothetical protein
MKPNLYEKLLEVAYWYLEECGCCCQYHPKGYDLECRDDKFRYYHPDELAEMWLKALKESCLEITYRSTILRECQGRAKT